jgi:glycosyltransferase involved in cell wall biosynthesis
MSKYKIGIIAKDILNQEDTGIENYTENLLKEFDKANGNFEFIVYVNHPLKNIYKNIRIVSLKNERFWLHRSIPRRIKNDNIDLVFSPIPSLPLILNKDVKKVITVHDLSFKYMGKNLNSTKFFIKNAIHNANKVIAVSKFTKNEILKNYNISKNKIEVIYEAYDKKLYYHTPKKRKNKSLNMLCLGTINKRKNFTHIVKVVPIIKDKFGETKLRIVGKKGDDYENLMKTITDFGLEKDVLVTGYVSNTRLADIFANTDVLLYISKEEGFGLPILEAFASGVAVVTSDNSAMKEIAENAAILVNPNDLMDMADGIIESIKRKNDLIKLGLLEAEKYSWEKSAKETLHLFNKLLS